MVKRIIAFATRILKKRSPILIAFLFLISMTITPVIGQVASQQNAWQLTSQATEFYQSENWQPAAQSWQKAADMFASQEDNWNQAMALSNLSLTYQQLGKWQAAKKAIEESISILKSQPHSDYPHSRASASASQTKRDKYPTDRQQLLLFQSLDIQGKLQQELGQYQYALATWQQASTIQRQIGDRPNNMAGIGDRLYQNQINQAEAMQSLGFYPLACKTLLKSLDLESSECKLPQDYQTLFNQPLSLVKAKALFSLADVLRVTGNLPQSKAIIEQTLQFKKAISLPIKSKALLSLAKTEEALGRRYAVDSAAANKNLENALIHYQQAINKSNDPLVNAQVLLEQFNLLIDRDRSTAAANLLPAIDHYLGQSRLNSQSIYTQVNLAKSLIFLQQQQSKYPQSNNQLLPEANQLLTNAIALAQQIEDTRAESYAAGNLGRLYEYQQQNNQAQQYSNRALKLAQAVQAKELAYQWDWQLARLFKETDILAAKTYYHQAYNILNDLRTDLVALNPEIRFSFRENIEPIYREYVDLLLLAPQPSQTNLKQARDVLEALQLAELDNFFRDACVNVKPEAVDQVVENAEKPTAVIYGIILKDRLEIILKLPGKENITSYRTKISQEDVAKNLNQLIERLRDRTRYSYQVQEYSQKVYEWIIRPVEEKLQSNNIENLVFVLDGLLRNIPMAVLYDQNEQKYLIEKYPIALAPGLQLLSPKPFKDIEPSQLNVLTAGLSEERLFEKEQRQFNRLDYVKQELEKIQLEVPASYELLDKNFDNQKLQAQLATNKYNVAHFATHGEFNSDPDKTFIVLSDKLLKVRDLDNLLRVEKGNQSIPIELLVLSACQTAVGDNRATLGLAGVAVRAGARSTIATLWSVGDESTAELMSKFYHQLINTDGINKAEALQKAQIKFLHDEKLPNKYWDRPYYWSSLVLLGNWL